MTSSILKIGLPFIVTMKLLLLELSDEDVDNRGVSWNVVGNIDVRFEQREVIKSVWMLVFMDEGLLSCMSWSKAGDPEVMAGFPPKSSSWPVTLLLSSSRSLISAASKWFVILFKDNYWWWPHLRPPNSFHLCPAPNLIPKVEVCILTQGDTYYLSPLLWSQFI